VRAIEYQKPAHMFFFHHEAGVLNVLIIKTIEATHSLRRRNVRRQRNWSTSRANRSKRYAEPVGEVRGVEREIKKMSRSSLRRGGSFNRKIGRFLHPAGCRFQRSSRNRNLFFVARPLPLGEGGAAAPGEGSPLHDLEIDEIVGRVALIRRSAPPSPGGRRTRE
jgi:hypothetical protein